MQRIVLVFLLLLLPVQWTWAAAASICRHESGIHAQHFGHHEHRHDHQAGTTASANSPDLAKAQNDSGAGGVHADCGTCHGAVTGLVMQAATVVGEPLPPLAFTPYQRP